VDKPYYLAVGKQLLTVLCVTTRRAPYVPHPMAKSGPERSQVGMNSNGNTISERCVVAGYRLNRLLRAGGQEQGRTADLPLFAGKFQSSATHAHPVVVTVLNPTETLIAARRLAGARPHLTAVAGIVHHEDLWQLCRDELTGVDVRSGGWDIRGRWFGVVVVATPRLGQLRRGETIPWRVIAAQLAPRQGRGLR
jgi:hypothetical protein